MAEKPKQRRFLALLSLPVSLVVLCIAYIYASTVFVFIEQWFGLLSSPGLINGVVFTLLAAMCVLTYTRAISADPGRVPSTYMPDVEDSQTPIHEIKRKVLLVGSLAFDDIEDEEKNGGSFRTVYVVSGLLLVPLSIALCVLLGWHVYLILHNKTTIEYHEGVRALWLAEKGGSIYKHPYDLGPYENLTSVMGPNILSWLWPTANHIGSGLKFRTVYDVTQGASTSK